MILDYVKISKPSIIFLLDFVAISALLVSYYSNVATSLSPPMILIGSVLLAGTLASAGAAAINAYIDRDIDVLMLRTSKRPVPMGSIPPKHALYFGIASLSLAFVTATLLLNLVATFMIMLGAFIYIFVYSVWLKRRTPWNIVIGGSAGSAAALAGWTAVTPQLEFMLPAVLMGVLVFLWTPSHFWSLAILTNRDYKAAGVPMAACRSVSCTMEKPCARFGNRSSNTWISRISGSSNASTDPKIMPAPPTARVPPASIREIKSRRFGS